MWSRTVGGRRAQGRQRMEIHKKSMLQKLSDWIGNGIWTIQTPVNQWRFLVGTISLTLRFPRLPCCNGGGELLQLFRRCFGMFQFLCKWKKKFRNLSFMLQCIATCKNDWCVKQRQHLYKSKTKQRNQWRHYSSIQYIFVSIWHVITSHIYYRTSDLFQMILSLLL